MRQERFDTPGPVTIEVYNKVGLIEVVGWDQPFTEVEVDSNQDELLEDTSISVSPTGAGHRVEVTVPARFRSPGQMISDALSGPRFSFSFSTVSGATVRVRTPHEAVLHLRSLSADIAARGRFSCLAESTSGNVEIDQASDLRAKSLSGDLVVHRLEGSAQLRTTSGDISAAHVRGGQVSLKTASGDLEVRSISSGDVRAESASGDIRLGVLAGRTVQVQASSVTGQASSDIDLDTVPPRGAGGEPADLVVIRAFTATGDVRIARVPSSFAERAG